MRGLNDGLLAAVENLRLSGLKNGLYVALKDDKKNIYIFLNILLFKYNLHLLP